MGNVFSSDSSGRRDAYYVTSEKVPMDDMSTSNESENADEFHDTIDDTEIQEARAKAKAEEMEEFKRQLEIKREQRREILNRHKTEKQELEKALESERTSRFEAYETNRMLRELLTRNNIDIPEDLQNSREVADITAIISKMNEEFETLKASNNRLRRDLAESNRALQSANSDIADLQTQNTESIKHINALKEVVSVSKTMINLREGQLNELKNKLDEIERSLADREASMLSADLRQEYVRQLQNIRTLRSLYEERARLAEVTRQGLARELEEQKLLTQAESIKSKELADKVDELEAKVDELQESIGNKNNQISTTQNETRGLKAEMSAINKLFSQVLLGYKTKQDLDKLVHRLEENHGLLTHMAEKENGSEASTALPKLLLELVSQVDEGEVGKDEPLEEDGSTLEKSADDLDTYNPVSTSAEEIVQNLPKVWRVLMELLSHQTAADESPGEKVTTCYKSVETKSGPVLVPSVSQTYIRLKDLIVEKLALIKEVNRMKQLNGHLETRLEEQERRLCLVTTELSKTWHVVGRLRRHHHQLHTHEKILKYELQQKRKLLNELKEELEYCREKWEQAREKNSQSERDWRKLRTEFSSRKSKSSAALNNSAESGYSDERPSDDSSESNDESREYVTDPLVRCKKKLKKSFETILDSSTDINLVAEREDPASDMLDVADLPLDTQDGDDRHDVSDSCNSESCLKSEKLSEETEDEVGEIAHDLYAEELSISEPYTKNSVTVNLIEDNGDIKSQGTDCKTPGNVSNEVSRIDPAAILKDIQGQNERLAKKDKRLEKLEKNSASLLTQTQNTTKLSELISETLDQMINRPSSSRQSNSNHNMFEEESKSDLLLEPKLTTVRNTKENTHTKGEVNEPENLTLDHVSDTKEAGMFISVSNVKINKDSQTHVTEVNERTVGKTTEQIDASISKVPTETLIENQDVVCIPTVDLKTILENVKKQNEHIRKKDERLENLEAECSDVVMNINKTLATGQQIEEKLDRLSDEYHNIEERLSPEEKVIENTVNEDQASSSRDSSESSTSEMDHEARFAARDLRLKRLEEQTKSLVNKVNDTTTKGIKITYKLEELHNIYGSENSRAGTPSEDREDRSQSNDDETQE